MADSARIRVLEANQNLLTAIAKGDYVTYSNLCVEDLTCFENETQGHLMVGLPFHKTFFDLPPPPRTTVSSSMIVTMANPHVRFLDDEHYTSAICCYTRFNQKVNGDGECIITTCCETRVWKWDTSSGQYKCVHVHKS